MKFTYEQKEEIRKEVADDLGVHLFTGELDKILAIVQKHAPKSFSRSVIEKNTESEPKHPDETTDAMNRAHRHANQEWKRGYMEAIEKTAEHMAEFTSDDVMESMQKLHPDLSTHENRAAGGLIHRAAKYGLCSKAGRTVQSRNPKHHRSNKTVWKSAILKG